MCTASPGEPDEQAKWASCGPSPTQAGVLASPIRTSVSGSVFSIRDFFPFPPLPRQVLELGDCSFDLFLDPVIEYLFPRPQLFSPLGQHSLLPEAPIGVSLIFPTETRCGEPISTPYGGALPRSSQCAETSARYSILSRPRPRTRSARLRCSSSVN